MPSWRSTGMIPEGLEAFDPEERRWLYKPLHLNVIADGSLSATWIYTRVAFIQENLARTRTTPTPVWAKFCSAWGAKTRLGRLTRQASGRSGKISYGGMAEDLRLALVRLCE